MRRIAIAVAAATISVSLAGCGTLNATGSDDASPTKGNDITVGLLLPEKSNPQYEQFHYPVIKANVASLTHGQGRVEYANAEADAGKQARQLQQMIDDRVDVILLDPIDTHAIANEVTKAKEAGIPVISYDRLAEGPIDAYITFDNELVGEVQGRSLLTALGKDAGVSDKIVMMNGMPTDPNAKQFKAGALNVLEGRVTIAKSFDTEGWKPANAEKNMTVAINEIGKDDIKAVYAANDGLAGSIVKALKAAGVTDLPPITGQDAELSAVQRIVTGEQYMSVYKPYPQEAENAARMAVTKAQGKNIQFDALTSQTAHSPTNKGIPTQLVPVIAVTKDNIKDTVIKDGMYKLSDICTPELTADCAATGLKK
ncbi:sugar ABC transporter substrate-binding protein [Streptomyces sp. NL15-2K]|uniref:sugar ABC transporter substrate-binding protein n=1 Tax=Streptomyces sp. NL15-2K TaxID=376149 RepID=UPI000F588183|nr:MULTISPECIES: substrate-binding domain-containing protein [Actinomycetes]WKX10014.1 substrate-binding domain-containing protein [Kutzneria buriramensis]GCB48441.1 L-arabinose-binding periplasmic protein precursor araF [Streptomyces sp. NL15-2K]